MAASRFAPGLFLTTLTLLGVSACGGGDDPTPTDPTGTGSGTEQVTAGGEGTEETVEDAPPVEVAEIPLVRYEWDPMAGDPSVTAADGGPGFTGEGWETNMEFPAVGSPKAVKGGMITMYMPSWPNTLRMVGQNSNTAFNYRARDLCMESLLGGHPATLEFIPGLATHWWISEDKATYRFRINPKARWNDGSEVVAQDVVATWKLLMDDGLLQPSNKITFGKFEEPVALSKYIVEVTVKQPSWRNFIYFSGMAIMPSHQVSIPGSEFLTVFESGHTATSGPYELKSGDIDLNKSIILRRRTNHWDADNPAWVGTNNFDAYKFVVVGDPILAFEKAKKGELDYYPVPKAQWWAEELVPEKVDAIDRGLIQRRKFFNNAPQGTAGLALNMTREPLDDLRVRKALAHLRDRQTLIEKLFFNEYEPLNSYWQGGIYQNPANELTAYDPFGAVELLEEAGWMPGDDGIRMKDGKRLSFNLIYRSKLSEPSLTVYKEDCERAGIEIVLKLIDPTALWESVQGKTYEIASMAWGALIYPNPETSFKGELADVPDNNNITAFKDDRVDELLVEYDLEYDVTKRAEIIREIDGIIFNQHPYVLDWYGPAQRVFYWNRFGMPDWGVDRFKDQEDMMYTWWVDPEKDAALQAAIEDPAMRLETEPIEHRFWEAWSKANPGK